MQVSGVNAVGVGWGCCSAVPQPGPLWHKARVSQFWRLQDQGQGVGGSVPPDSSLHSCVLTGVCTSPVAPVCPDRLVLSEPPSGLLKRSHLHVRPCRPYCTCSGDVVSHEKQHQGLLLLPESFPHRSPNHTLSYMFPGVPS